MPATDDLIAYEDGESDYDETLATVRADFAVYVAALIESGRIHA